MKAIAQSTLWICRDPEPREKCTIKIGAPEKDPKPGGDYRCEIKIPIFPMMRFIYGIDSLQAIMLATNHIRSCLLILADGGYSFYLTKTSGEKLDLRSIWQPTLGEKKKKRRT